jgi:hypothetical protein
MKTQGLEIRPLYLRRANRRQAYAFIPAGAEDFTGDGPASVEGLRDDENES